MIRPPISIPRNLTSSSTSMKRAVSQQVGEAWFADISQVPKQGHFNVGETDSQSERNSRGGSRRRKAQAVKACFEGEISPMAPASILGRHPNTTVYLDTNSAWLLGSTAQSTLARDSQVTVARKSTARPAAVF